MPVYEMLEYPKTVELSNGLTIQARPMTSEDEAGLLDFFLTIPDSERYYLKEDVTSPQVISRWVRSLDYARVLPILALDGESIVGDATLHRLRSGAQRHMGEVRVVVKPSHRSKGVGTALIKELILIAKDAGLEKLVIELVEDEQQMAMQAMSALGFVRLATLPDYVRDVQGKRHDVVLMELPLEKWGDLWEF